MRHRFLTSLRVLAVVAWLAPVPVAGGQTPTTIANRTKAAPTTLRTPWGDPDLQGIWTNHHQVPLERPSQYAGKQLLTDAEVAALEAQAAQGRDRPRPPRQGQVGAYNDFWNEREKRSTRTSMIVDPPDGKLPPMTPEGKRTVDAGNEGRSAGSISGSWEDRDAYERCITRGMPGAMIPGFYNHNYQILQSPGYVVIHVEMIHDARIIPLDGRAHLPQNLRQWMGDSRGRWEGNTLVVETSNFNARVGIRSQPTYVAFGTGEMGRVLERFTRIDADTIDYQFTVEDPTTFTRPWTASSPMKRIQEQIYEYACHEGNYALPDILAGAPAQEKAAEEGEKRRSR